MLRGSLVSALSGESLCLVYSREQFRLTVGGKFLLVGAETTLMTFQAGERHGNQNRLSDRQHVIKKNLMNLSSVLLRREHFVLCLKSLFLVAVQREWDGDKMSSRILHLIDLLPDALRSISAFNHDNRIWVLLYFLLLVIT